MWEDNRFVVMRDPQKGGLHIAAATEGVTEDIQDEIMDNCIELIARDKEHLCTCIYPLLNSGYVIAIARKVTATSQEPREHEVIRGIVLDDEDELTSFCQAYMEEECMKGLFFPENTDFDHLEDWTLPVINAGHVMSVDLVNQMEGRELLGLFHALKETAKNHLKIQLIVEDHEKFKTMALLGCMQEITGTRLFMTVGGECTLKNPDILILDQAVYQDPSKYYKMNLKEFIRMGSNLIKHAGVPVMKTEPEDEKKEKLLDFCFDYIMGNYISEYEVYEVLGNLKKTDACLYSRFIRSLRKELFSFPQVECYAKRYMKLLYIAFKREREEKAVELETAPYDFQEMHLFLTRKSRNKREQKKLLMMMLETQFQECMGKTDERLLHEAARNIVEMH